MLVHELMKSNDYDTGEKKMKITIRNGNGRDKLTLSGAIILIIFVLFFAFNYSKFNHNSKAEPEIKPSSYQQSLYNINKNTDNIYIVTLYGKDKNVVSQVEALGNPAVSVIDDHILKFQYSVSGGINTAFFYDTDLGIVSKQYMNDIYAKYGKIVYLKDENKIVVNDIFDDELNYEKVLDNLVFTVPRTNAIYNVKFITANKLRIKYVINKYGMSNEANERVSKTLDIIK